MCVFLFGGSDSNNMIVPYTDYARVRGRPDARRRTSASPRRSWSSSVRRVTAKTYGFHPSTMPTANLQLAPLYNAGKLAVIANSGTLIRPMTKAQYNSPGYRPPSLFSHSDQQDQYNGLLMGAPVRTGWGGRMRTGSSPPTPAR